MSLYRKVLRITAADSPNVRREEARLRGDPPETWQPEIPGVLSYAEYRHRLATWDVVKQCVGLHARHYKGVENLLFPPAWLNRAEEQARVRLCRDHAAEAVGIDTGEGVADTSMAAVNRFGLKELISCKTADTSVIPGAVLAFMRRHLVPPERVLFDRGGGGKQHADRLRADGFKVRTLAFGETPTLEARRVTYPVGDRREIREEKSVYFNMRAQLYGELRQLLDPAREPEGFALPAEYPELRRQLAPIPLLWNREGQLELPPKNRRPGTEPTRGQKTLCELIGRSPDDADAVVLAVHAMLHPEKRVKAGAY